MRRLARSRLFEDTAAHHARDIQASTSGIDAWPRTAESVRGGQPRDGGGDIERGIQGEGHDIEVRIHPQGL